MASCNGSGGGKGSDPAVLDARLFEGSATWEVQYTITGTNWVDEFQFVGDELYRTQTGYAAGGTMGPINNTYSLEPVTNRSMRITKVSDPTDTGIWTYAISGTTLHACDPQANCLDFIKQ